MTTKTLELDLSGLVCPQPVLQCRAFLEQAQRRAFTAYVDNEAASINVQHFLEQRGFRVTIEKTGELWSLAAVNKEAAQHNDAPAVHQLGKKILVLLSTEHLGIGDDGLGAKLMAGFLSTLPEMGDALWRVILLNSGVKLAAERAGAPQALQALQALEQSGVSILVCGTCLGHYGLSTQQAVGVRSNMLDIVTSLSLADLVIRP